MKNRLSYLIGIIMTFCLMITLLITSVEAVVYWTPGYFEKEYTKYGVNETVRMTMEDLLNVTDEMMDYLRGNREDLHVLTVVDGQQREFFSQREIAHMEDVQGLFLAAMTLRNASVMLMILGFVLLLLLKVRVRHILPRAVCVGTVVFFGLTAVLAGIISTDFSRYFVMFHHIFFNNDLWILDPATDLLINIVPEGFFSDTTLRIGLTYGACILAVLVSSIFIILKDKKNKA